MEKLPKDIIRLLVSEYAWKDAGNLFLSSKLFHPFTEKQKEYIYKKYFAYRWFIKRRNSFKRRNGKVIEKNIFQCKECSLFIRKGNLSHLYKCSPPQILINIEGIYLPEPKDVLRCHRCNFKCKPWEAFKNHICSDILKFDKDFQEFQEKKNRLKILVSGERYRCIFSCQECKTDFFYDFKFSFPRIFFLQNNDNFFKDIEYFEEQCIKEEKLCPTNIDRDLLSYHKRNFFY